MCQENATTANKKSKGDLSRVVKEYFVIRNAIQSFVKQNLPKKNTQTGKEELLLIKHIDAGLKNIPNIWHISKLGDTQDKEMQRVRTLLRNGKNFVENIIGDVLNARSVKNLLKITSNHFQQMEQIIFQTYSHFVGRAIVVSGSFNIYENPELLK